MLSTDTQLVQIRWLIVATLAALTILVTVRLWMVEGLVLRPVSIDGPSMAPALVGLHYAVTCDDCAFAFACDAQNAPASGQV
ncbi:MAG TPA: hypothetical protein VFV87_20355, partial [Pirellulaceae bacterium]|nr:hypothetical protein [Pirellulaceae bacterium]